MASLFILRLFHGQDRLLCFNFKHDCICTFCFIPWFPSGIWHYSSLTRMCFFIFFYSILGIHGFVTCVRPLYTVVIFNIYWRIRLKEIMKMRIVRWVDGLLSKRNQSQDIVLFDMDFSALHCSQMKELHYKWTFWMTCFQWNISSVFNQFCTHSLMFVKLYLHFT